MTEKHVRTFALELTLSATVAVLGACGGDAVDGAAAATTGTSDVVANEPRGPAADPPPAPRTLVVQNDDGSTSTVRVVDVDGRTLFEGDIELPAASSTRGSAITGKRWHSRTVPYVTDPALPLKSRVTDAIAHWEARTQMRFVARTTESDYVRFTPGRNCSSPMGRVGSRQDVVLQAGMHLSTMAGADFSPTTNRAHFWFKNGLRSVGRSSNIDEHELPVEYTLPAGKTTANVIDMAFAPSGDVYTWYRDLTFSVGTPSNLGSISESLPFTLPAGRGLATGRVLGIAFSPDGHTHAWYDDGTTSEGTAQDLGAHVASQAFTLPAGQSTSDVLALGIASGGTVYAWYWSGKASGGLATSPGSTYAPYEVKTPGHCGLDQAIHEIGHAVGLPHEQTRKDRDQFVTIHWNNITSSSSYNFDLRMNDTPHGTYDFASIMHYHSWAFSSNGQATITRKDGATIGDASQLSSGDIGVVAWMYP